MNKLTEIICDSCEGKFIFGSIELKKDTIQSKDEDINVTYYICPHCKKLYVVYIENEELKELKLSFEASKARVEKLKDNGRLKAYHIKQLNRELAELRQSSEALSDRYAGEFYLLDTENNK